MKILFFIVHPSKYHLFKNLFVKLDENDIEYEVCISSKDVLSDLLKSADIPYTDLFPNGRKINGIPVILNVAISFFRTVWRLLKYTKGKKFDVYVTDDILTMIGRLRRVPSIIFIDNDIQTIPKVKYMLKLADKIIAPVSTDMGNYSYKKISFKGNKALAHLHPNYYQPDLNFVKLIKSDNEKLLIIRLSKLNASHDAHGNQGITDQNLDEIFELLPPDYIVKIISEREIPDKYKSLLTEVDPFNFTNVLAASDFFIGDSGTMATEAAMLGVPNILINNIAKMCGVHVELRNAGLQTYFDNFSDSKQTFESQIKDVILKTELKRKLDKYISGADDFNETIYSLILQLGSSNKK